MQTPRSLFTAALLISVTGLGLPACAETFAGSGYQITTPNGWITNPGPYDRKITTVFYCATRKNSLPALPVVEVAVRPQAGMTMEKLMSYAPWIMGGTFPGFHQTSAAYTPLDGVSAFDISGTYPRGRQTIGVRELFAIHDGEAYIITTAYPIEKRAMCEPLSSSVIRSIRWR